MKPRAESESGVPLWSDPVVRRFRVLVAAMLVGGLALAVFLVAPPYLSLEVDTINLYSFTGLQDVVQEGLVAAFKARYEENTGRQLEVITSFGGSGRITRQIVRDVPAHVVLLSSPVDALYASRQGVRRSGDSLPYGGVVASSPLALIVRPGNPRGIREWADLTRGDVEVIHPDPTTSGAGVWSVLAQYRSVARAGDPSEAVEQLTRMRDRVTVWPASAAAAWEVFASGTGDVLVDYAHAAGSEKTSAIGVPVYPRDTVLAQFVGFPIAGPHASTRHREIAEAFSAFLFTEQAQQLFRSHGLWPPAGEDPLPPALEDTELFTLEDLGGAAAASRILEQVWYRQVRPPRR